MFTAGSRTGSLNTAVCASSLKGKTKQLYLDKGNKKTSNKKNMICCFIALFLPKFPSRVRIPKLEWGGKLCYSKSTDFSVQKKN